jgi:hypothetical protein
MAINDNQNTRFIYIRSTKQKISCTEQQFQDFYRMAGAVRKKGAIPPPLQMPEKVLLGLRW